MTRCACGNEKCPQQIWFGGFGHELWFKSVDNKEYLMYMDANAIVGLIEELRQALREMANHED